MVVICRKVDIDALNVTTDETKAMETAMDYLIENGHRNICVIEGAPNLDSTRLRHIGWQNAARKHGLDPDIIPTVSGTYRYASGYQGAKLLLEYHPTALLCFNDEMAFGALNMAKKSNLKPNINFFTGGIGGSDESIEAVTNGEMTATIVGQYMEGAWTTSRHVFGNSHAARVGAAWHKWWRN
jgi:DNA-binding LacI/PurR family transcriptional regulator